MSVARHPERVFLREGSPDGGTVYYRFLYQYVATDWRSFAQKDALRMTSILNLMAVRLRGDDTFGQNQIETVLVKTT